LRSRWHQQNGGKSSWHIETSAAAAPKYSKASKAAKNQRQQLNNQRNGGNGVKAYRERQQ
jgi:hypothetical protein